MEAKMGFSQHCTVGLSVLTLENGAQLQLAPTNEKVMLQDLSPQDGCWD